MRKTVATAIAATFSFGLAGLATADEITFQSLDDDNDGFISRDEIPSDHELARHFMTHDTDGDGRLSMAEFEAYKSSRRDDNNEY